MNKLGIWTTMGFFCIQSILWAEIQWLQYHTSPHAREVVGGSSQFMRPDKNPPAELELPELSCDTPLHFVWNTAMDAVGHRRMVMDKERKYGLYDTLYFDSDGDGNLSDETKTKGRQTSQYEVEFPGVRMTFDGEDGPVTYHLNLRFYSYDSNSTYMYAYSGGWYEGTVQLGDKEIRCILIDYNCNGTFDDKSDNFNNDRIRTGPTEPTNESYVGNFVELDDTLYRLSVARDGAFVEFTPAPHVPYVQVTMPETITSFSAGGVNGMFRRTVEDGRVKLPEGKYRIHSWAIEQSDEKGVKWTLRASGGNGSKCDFIVGSGQQTHLDIGEPIFSYLKAPLRNNQYYFNQELKGRFEERISLEKDGNRRPPAPRIQVVNKTGEYDRTFTLEYG
jgi:hypothetical protein